MTGHPLRARWLDLGVLEPLSLHAHYQGLAEAQRPDAAPVVLLARAARAHVSIGASQAADADLDLDACKREGIPVVQRPLGGGSVWVDGSQSVILLIFPRNHLPGRHEQLFETCLEPLCSWMRQCGLDASRVGGQDIWAGGRKILGSGAATIGSAMVFATSVLRVFDAQGFARAVRAPTDGFRDWLAQALAAGMTDWCREGVEIEDAALAAQLREVLARSLGWRFEDSALSPTERRAIAEAEAELAEELVLGGPRHVRFGIKINQQRYLLEEPGRNDALRLLVNAGRIERLALDDDENGPWSACIGEPVDRHRLEDCLAAVGVPAEAVADLSQRIMRLTADIPV